MIEYITAPATLEGSEGLIAIVIRTNCNIHSIPRGTKFVTDNLNALQLAVINMNPNDEIKPHRHLPVKRESERTQEALFVRYGTLTITLYSHDGCMIDYVTLSAGDVILLMGGAHSIKTYTNTEIVEVKIGPYYGRDKDKIDIEIKP